MVDHYQSVMRQVMRLLKRAPVNGRWHFADADETETFAHAFARICETARDIEAILESFSDATTADEADGKLIELEILATLIGRAIVRVRHWDDLVLIDED